MVERRQEARQEGTADRFVSAALADGSQARAQVLDQSPNGLRLLFRPGVHLNPGMAISLRDDNGNTDARARVQWCRHKHRFTVAGLRCINDPANVIEASAVAQLS